MTILNLNDYDLRHFSLSLIASLLNPLAQILSTLQNLTSEELFFLRASGLANANGHRCLILGSLEDVFDICLIEGLKRRHRDGRRCIVGRQQGERVAACLGG